MDTAGLAAAPNYAARPGLAAAVDTAGLAAYGGNVIRLPDGHTATLALPAGTEPIQVIAASGGWAVVTFRGEDVAELWFAADPTRPRLLGRLFGNVRVSEDGRTLVAAGLAATEAAQTVVAFELPSLRERKRGTFHTKTGPLVAGVAGDKALLLGASDTPGVASTAVWNLATGALGLATGRLWHWGVSRDGQVLRRLDRPDLPSCLNVTALDVPATPTGLCDAAVAKIWHGLLSPTAERAVLRLSTTVGNQTTVEAVLVQVADVRAGRWVPMNVAVEPGSVVLFWDSDTTFITVRPVGEDDLSYQQCGLQGRCRALTLPADVPHAALVTPAGR